MFSAGFGMPAEAPAPAQLEPRVELVLRTEEGEPWILSFSPGIEQFIGHYPRLDGIAPEGTLLAFRRIRSQA